MPTSGHSLSTDNLEEWTISEVPQTDFNTATPWIYDYATAITTATEATMTTTANQQQHYNYNYVVVDDGVWGANGQGFKYKKPLRKVVTECCNICKGKEIKIINGKEIVKDICLTENCKCH